MITKELMDKAAVRCLEIVNDGKCHAKYHPVFKQQLDTYGAEALRQAAAFAKQGKWGWLNGTWPTTETGKWTSLRAQCEMAGYEGVTQSRVVFGLVLEHWLSSNVSAPAKPVPPWAEQCKPSNQPVTYEEICNTLDKLAPQGTPKETVMLKITHATYVNGTDVKTLSVDALVGLISTTEKEIEKLEALGSKPKKVLKKIDELKEGLAELVKIADED